MATAAQGPEAELARDEPEEKIGMRNAWGRIALPYDQYFTERTAHLTARGLDLLAPEPDWDGLDVACGPGSTTRALADRLPNGTTLGVDFAEPMVRRATEGFSRPGLSFAVDDAEHLSLPDEAFGAVTCSFGLMYCYDARGAVRHMARVLRAGGRLMVLVWGRAQNVWFSPVIELIESRAEFYASICPMLFYFGLPRVLSRMFAEADLTVMRDEALPARMRFPSTDEAREAGILGGPLAGLFSNRLNSHQQQEVREALAQHISRLAEATDGGEIDLPAEARIVVGQKPA